MPPISTETLAVTSCAFLLVVLALSVSAVGRPDPIGADGSLHRAISFGFLSDAVLVVLAGSILNPALPDLVPLGAMLAVTLFAGLRIYRRQPSPIL
ncbi:MAG TPA: hypothetical protein VFY48_01895 [Solirubrobacterales bacterium]|nr:hypothetical protein [Solirubrobacterales bacterium]